MNINGVTENILKTGFAAKQPARCSQFQPLQADKLQLSFKGSSANTKKP